tara:strand:- start:214 stop:1707 length:1494 start_codon:yes stop_codon:yes gene_type:complete
MKKIQIILGNQLFPISEIKKLGSPFIFMAEDEELCSEPKNHKLKILNFLISMREYRDDLIKQGFKVFYTSIDEPDFNKPYELKLLKVLKQEKINEVFFYEIEDYSFEKKIKDLLDKNSIKFSIISSPMFLCPRDKFLKFSENNKIHRMTSFYQMMRKELGILVDENNKPIGGKWSFDSDNRKKLPKDVILPVKPKNRSSIYLQALGKIVNLKFKDHPGTIKNHWVPFNREQALQLLDDFLENKLENFGKYEDAIDSNNNFLFHSAISPVLNMGLITPQEVIEKTFIYHERKQFPLNSLEGFIRQVIGWREFIRGIYNLKGQDESNGNFWNHDRLLTKDWYEGTTGITPLDDTIKDCVNYGYTHHIPRLMIIANIMNLSRIHPAEIYKWFMEMFVDSADWVMTPNVYGMGTFADGGLFATKPYSCGSNYILKMSNYKKGEWCEILDGLYWSFISDNESFFKKNPRLSIMCSSLNRMDPKRKEIIFIKAKNFIKEKTKK